MKEQLRAALEGASKGDTEAVIAAAEQIRKLPRREDGLFDTGAVDSDLFEAARWVYPVYAAYETECNKKEGYPDLLNQMRILDREYEKNGNREQTGSYLSALIHTVENVSPQLYEYYRELADTFKKRVKEAISKQYHDGGFGNGDALIRESIRRAGEAHVLLIEKYQEYCQEV